MDTAPSVQFSRTRAIRVAETPPELFAGVLSLANHAQGHWFPTCGTSRRIPFRVRLAVFDAGRCECLCVTSPFDELALKPGYLPVKEVVRLVDQANNGIGHDGRVFVNKPLSIGGGVELIGRIGRIRLIGPIKPPHSGALEH